MLKFITGNPGNRPLNENAPEPVEGELKPPGWLCVEARGKWDSIVRSCPWITAVDGDVLTVYCDAWVRLEQARAEYANQPTLIGKGGVPIKNPALTAMNEAWQQLRSSGSELGLTPSSRSGIKDYSKTTVDPAEELLSRG